VELRRTDDERAVITRLVVDASQLTGSFARICDEVTTRC
jgi:hypothetical protein